MKTSAIALALAAALVLGVAPKACADNYLGLYGGASFTSDVHVKNNSGTITTQGTFQTTPLVGGKIGTWLKTSPWLAAEVNVWALWPNRKTTGQDLTLVNVSGSLLLQAVSGPVRVYAGGGPLGTWAEARNGTTDHDLALGALGQAGIEFNFIPFWGVFAEYRYTWNGLDFDKLNEKFDLDRHTVLAGVSLRY